MKNNKEIEERFDKLDMTSLGLVIKNEEDRLLIKSALLSIKSFITSEISLAVAEREKEIVEMIGNNKQINTANCRECEGFGYTAGHDLPWNHNPTTGECISCPIQIQCGACEANGICEIPNLEYNQALEDIINLITKNNEPR
jgi:hypothetical protein